MANLKRFSNLNEYQPFSLVSGTNDRVVVYRFGNRASNADWESYPRQTNTLQNCPTDDGKLNDLALKFTSFGKQSDESKISPFLPVVTDPKTFNEKCESWVQKILAGSPDLGVFGVPFTELVRPSPTKLISKDETEWLFYDANARITTYLIQWRPNPYKV